MRTLLTARHVVGHDNGRHCLIENGEVVIEADRILFVGRKFPGEVAQRHDFGLSLLGPGLIDLDALSDLDTTILGTDTWPPDLVVNMQVGVLLGRVADGTAANTRAADLYDAATIGGADALQRPDLGRLMPGAQADITVFDFSHPLIGRVIDPIQTLLIGAAGRDVRDVFVAGRHVVQNGTLPGFDLAAAHACAQAQFDELVAKYPERTWKHPPVAQIFQPSYPKR